MSELIDYIKNGGTLDNDDEILKRWETLFTLSKTITDEPTQLKLSKELEKVKDILDGYDSESFPSRMTVITFPIIVRVFMGINNSKYGKKIDHYDSFKDNIIDSIKAEEIIEQIRLLYDKMKEEIMKSSLGDINVDVEALTCSLLAEEIGRRYINNYTNEMV